MKEIKINRLTLENFKCHRLLNLVLDGRSASVYGDNATGKTSIYDALTWLLFGKDSRGNGEKNIDIKPLNTVGEVADHRAITSVEAEFSVDGEISTFRRTYRELWTTKRGSGEPTYDGNTSDYYVDGVPMKKNTFDSAIRELVSEDLFRMLTSVSYFAETMKWQDRRAMLFDMAGTRTDREIMAEQEVFAPLMDSLGKLTLPEYKTKLLHQRKGLMGVRDDAPTRINECQKMLEDLNGLDYSAARAEEQSLCAQRDGIQAQLMELEQDSTLEKKRLELREAKFVRDQLESRNRMYRDSQKKTGPDQEYLRRMISAEQMRLESSRDFQATTKQSIERLEKNIQASREEYVQVNGEAFAGGICPSCGQTLPFEKLQDATRAFEQAKNKCLEAIVEKAHDMQEERDNAQALVEKLENEIRSRQEHIAQMQKELSAGQAEMVNVTDLPEYGEHIAQLEGRVDELQKEISCMMSDSAQVRTRLRSDLDEVNAQIRRAQATISREDQKVQIMCRIQELKTDARNASEALESIEKMLYLMEEFSRYKAKFVEDSINDLFHIATFRLFREQANGGMEERCDVVQNGIPFMGLNNGMKVNVGIDIINSLSRHYGVTVPLFVDNAEAVTQLESCNSQVIRLVVSEEDKELRII